MKIRNIGEARSIAPILAEAHGVSDDDLEHGAVIDVPDELGVSLCEQVDIWQPADADGKKQVEAAQRKADKAARAAEKQDAAEPHDAAPVADKAGE